MFKLGEIPNPDNFMVEEESRWNLVERAWELGVSRSLLDVAYDEEKNVVGDKDGFSAGRCKNTLIPLPPIAEQVRIVEKLDELLALI